MQMQIFRRAVLGLMVLGLTLSVLAIFGCGGGDENNEVKRQANLSGATEVPAVPNSPGTGTAVLTINDAQTQISYVVTYTGLTGVTQAHIHVGSPTERGGIILYLCTNPSIGGGAAPAGAAGAQPCPLSAGTVTGILTAVDVVPVPAQGVTSFAEAITQLLSGNTYTNIHTQANTGGEIRGQDL